MKKEHHSIYFLNMIVIWSQHHLFSPVICNDFTVIYQVSICVWIHYWTLVCHYLCVCVNIIMSLAFMPLPVQFSSVTQSCPTLCDPRNHSTPGLPVHHHLPEFTQTHVHRVSDAIQPSHPLSSPSPPAPNLSQHQSLFQ